MKQLNNKYLTLNLVIFLLIVLSIRLTEDYNNRIRTELIIHQQNRITALENDSFWIHYMLDREVLKNSILMEIIDRPVNRDSIIGKDARQLYNLIMSEDIE